VDELAGAAGPAVLRLESPSRHGRGRPGPGPPSDGPSEINWAIRAQRIGAVQVMVRRIDQGIGQFLA